MQATHAQLSVVGPVREINEDFIACWQPNDEAEARTTGAAWMLADGVGGESRGEVASQLAVTAAIQVFQNAAPQTPVSILQRAMFDAASRAVYDAATEAPDAGPMATTLTISVLRENTLHVAHVGDSRVYHVRHGKIRRLTTDHCAVALPVKFRLMHEHTAMTSPMRSRLTRSVGHEPIANYDTTREQLQKGDIVVQCSDGLYGFVVDEEICDIVSHHVPAEAGRRLIALAEKRQVDDNISVQIIRVDETDLITSYRGRPIYLDKSTTTTTVSNEFEPGSILDDRFEVTELISRSGMACIYKARDYQTSQVVALKVPHMQFESDVATFTRFQREEEIGRQLDHPYILKVLTVDRPKSRPYLVMEFLEGETLDTVMEKVRPLPEKEAAKIVSRVCEALAHMHSRGIVHRDLKPQNIMVCKDGSIRILDFGIAKAARMRRLTFAGFSPTMGTPDYMAPEQVNGRRGDQRTDIYSLGAILYEMVTGKVPFEGESPYVVMNVRTTGDPVAPRKLNPQLTPVIEEIVLHALARNPDDRYESAEKMKAELDDYEIVPLIERYRTLQPVQPWKNKFRLLPVIGLFLFLLLAGYALIFWYLSAHGRH
jgi:serine/threonine protein phosphatase PrpC/predicted Ser/Thr protein kinase